MPRILIVDDELTVRMLLRDVLEIEGYEVVEAEDGPEALALMGQQRPDLVLLDIMMPGMSGIDVLAQVRSDVALHDLPVVLLTAAGDDDTTWAGWTTGASLYLNKPFDHVNLLEWVARLLSEARTKQAV
ncbi:MAG: response regulator [Actinobacteria bacterium]|jgi:two-component system sensor histidine kinase ChiS|nr:response regulator [Actinomycetota bacterium]